jgi:hypothetical protein
MEYQRILLSAALLLKIKTMKKILFYCLTAIALISCGKDDTAPANPLAALNGNWANNSWGGTSGNQIVIAINQNAATGSIVSLGSQTYNFSVGEVIFSNITRNSANSSLFNCNAIFKYGPGNTQTANTTATITLQNNQQILVQYTAAAGIQPPDYTYTKQ